MKLFIFILNLLLALNVYASEGGGGVTAGGGGGGVVVGESAYLYDLFVAGFHLKPYFFSQKLEPNLTEQLKSFSSFSFLTQEEVRLLKLKLQDIVLVDPVLGAAVIKAMMSLNWSMPDVSLLKTADMVDKTVIAPAPEVIPLAVRQGAAVYLHNDHWRQMNAGNRVALLIHEVLAALAPARHPGDAVRAVVAAFFDENFYNLPPKRRIEVIQYFPNINEAGRRMGLRQFGVTGAMVAKESSYRILGPALKTAESLVFPTVMNLSWTDRRTWTQKMLETTQTPDTEMFVTRPGASVEAYDFCSRPQRGYQLSSIFVNYMTVELSWPAVVKNEVEPRFNWTLKPHLFYHSFSREASTTLASCSATDVAAMAALKTWTQSIAMVRTFAE